VETNETWTRFVKTMNDRFLFAARSTKAALPERQTSPSAIVAFRDRRALSMFDVTNDRVS